MIVDTHFVNWTKAQKSQVTEVQVSPDALTFVRVNPNTRKYSFHTYHPRNCWREAFSTMTFRYNFRAYITLDEDKFFITIEPAR